jgi:hypothetical protein
MTEGNTTLEQFVQADEFEAPYVQLHILCVCKPISVVLEKC